MCTQPSSFNEPTSRIRVRLVQQDGGVTALRCTHDGEYGDGCGCLVLLVFLFGTNSWLQQPAANTVRLALSSASTRGRVVGLDDGQRKCDCDYVRSCACFHLFSCTYDHYGQS